MNQSLAALSAAAVALSVFTASAHAVTTTSNSSSEASPEAKMLAASYNRLAGTHDGWTPEGAAIATILVTTAQGMIVARDDPQAKKPGIKEYLADHAAGGYISPHPELLAQVLVRLLIDLLHQKYPDDPVGASEHRLETLLELTVEARREYNKQLIVPIVVPALLLVLIGAVAASPQLRELLHY
ncbi:MAG: hypothetical protein SPI77_08045 [Corynebacterium sp.]|nr:hypothetical protein [Corynebacterium sp.]